MKFFVCTQDLISSSINQFCEKLFSYTGDRMLMLRFYSDPRNENKKLLVSILLKGRFSSSCLLLESTLSGADRLQSDAQDSNLY